MTDIYESLSPKNSKCSINSNYFTLAFSFREKSVAGIIITFIGMETAAQMRMTLTTKVTSQSGWEVLFLALLLPLLDHSSVPYILPGPPSYW